MMDPIRRTILTTGAAATAMAAAPARIRATDQEEPPWACSKKAPFASTSRRRVQASRCW